MLDLSTKSSPESSILHHARWTATDELLIELCSSLEMETLWRKLDLFAINIIPRKALQNILPNTFAPNAWNAAHNHCWKNKLIVHKTLISCLLYLTRLYRDLRSLLWQKLSLWRICLQKELEIYRFIAENVHNRLKKLPVQIKAEKFI